MGYFSNNKTVNLDILKQSGIYSQELLEEIENNNYQMIMLMTDDTQRKDKDYMEPLLYAVKNEYGTYEIYKYYGENLQENIDLAKEIVVEEPELIKDTPISYNRQFILEAVEINPRVVIHMASTLKSDSEFTQDLCELKDAEVTRYVAKECKIPEVIEENPILSKDPIFMREVIKQDAANLQFASEELKNDYKFIKEVCKDNKEVIEHITENTDKFGKEGLTGTKDALISISTEEAVTGFEQEKKDIKEKIESAEGKEEDDKLKELLKRNKQLERHIRFFERIKNGEIDPVRAAKLIDKYCVNLDEEYKKELKQLLKIDEAIIQRQKEEKENADKQDLKEEVTIGLGSIEKKAEGASLEGVKEETKIIREEIEKQRSTTNEIGEQTNDDNDERT